MDKPVITQKQIRIAFVIAVFADALDFLFAWIETIDSNFCILFGKFMSVFLDCCVMAAMTKLLGFHWALLPSFCVEAVPKLDMFPTWVGCVMFVVWERKKEESGEPPPVTSQLRRLLNFRNVESANVPTPARPPVPPVLPAPPQLSPIIEIPPEKPAVPTPAQPPPPPLHLRPVIEIPSEMPAQTPPSIEPEVEQRLKRLKDLRDKNLISQAEYETKRDQILADI